jgi:putative peptidoglycan lipid II flippase
MVSRLLRLLNQDINTMNQAALVLAIFSLLSQLFGLLRDHLLASLIGPSASLDVYYAAFRIPDFIYNSFASLFSVIVIIPFLTNYLQQTEEKKSSGLKHFTNNIFSVYCFGMISISIIAFFLMPILTKLTAPGFNSVQQAQLILYSRVMLLSPFLLGLSSLLGSFAQVQRKFFSFAISPLFYNVGILIGIVALRPFFGVMGIVFGVILGALLSLAIQVPTLLHLHKLPTFVFRIDWKLIKEVITTSLPRTFALSLTNLTTIVMSALASLLVAGSLSIFQFSYNIETTPLMIIGISYAVAAFPTLTRLFAEGQKKEFIDIIHRATRNIFFLSIPASFLIIVIRAQIVRVLLGAGEFTWNDTRLVAASVALFSISVTAQCMVLLLVRGFYASGNTKSPLKINALSVLVTGISAAILLFAYHQYPMFRDFLESLLRIEGTIGSSVVLLPLAFSIGQITNAILLWIRLHKKLEGHKAETKELGKTLFHTVGAGIIAASIAYLSLLALGSGVDQDRYMGVVIQGFFAGLAGIITYGGVLFVLRNEDLLLFIQTLRSKFWKQKPLTPEQMDL